LPGRGNLCVVLEGDQCRHPDRTETAAERLQLSVPEVLCCGDGRVSGNGEDRVPVGTVIEQSAAAAEHDALRPRQVVRHTETRADNEIRPDVARLRDAIAGLPDSVVQVA